MLFTLAFRNILRNRRRSAMTSMAIAVGTIALLVFGAFQGYLFDSFHTNVVQRSGHLTVYRTGYFLFGEGNPSAYGIERYKKVLALIGDDPVLRPLIYVLTPTLSLMGIAGNFSGENDAAKTFIADAVIPSDRDRMRRWNAFGAGRVYPPDTNLDDNDPMRGFVGLGLARILGLCRSLAIANCPPPPAIHREAPGVASEDFSNLRAEVAAAVTPNAAGKPRLDLLAATVTGAPNVVSFFVNDAEPQPIRELDDNYVVMHLTLGQQLIYGRGEPRVTGIVLQLRRSSDIGPARNRLQALFDQHGLELEVRDFAELNPFYTQTLNFFRSIFLFIAAIMGVIVLFTVVNTMTMTIMERTNEIGTTRAMGVRRGGIRRQFLVEGCMLGVIGASIGLVIAFLVAIGVNQAGLTWVPPANISAIPLRLSLLAQPALIVGTWVGLILVATLAALIPANRAARLQIVDALRHV